MIGYYNDEHHHYRQSGTHPVAPVSNPRTQSPVRGSTIVSFISAGI